MTSSQRRLYNGMLRLFRQFHTGGVSWAGIRASGGTPATDAVLDALPVAPLLFVQNNRAKEAMALPQTLLYTAPWCALLIGGAVVDVQVGDVRSDGTYAFLVQGIDTSQGFQLLLADVATLPANHARRAFMVGYQTGLRIGM